MNRIAIIFLAWFLMLPSVLPEPGMPPFQIVSCEIDPKVVRNPLEAPGETVRVTVGVRNNSASGDATVEIAVLDSGGTGVAFDSESGRPPNPVPEGETKEFGLSFRVDKTWEGGNYSVNARVSEGIDPCQEINCKTLTVYTAKTPVPETSELLLPLLGAAVLVVIWLGLRKRQNCPANAAVQPGNRVK